MFTLSNCIRFPGIAETQTEDTDYRKHRAASKEASKGLRYARQARVEAFEHIRAVARVLQPSRCKGQDFKLHPAYVFMRQCV